MSSMNWTNQQVHDIDATGWRYIADDKYCFKSYLRYCMYIYIHTWFVFCICKISDTLFYCTRRYACVYVILYIHRGAHAMILYQTWTTLTAFIDSHVCVGCKVVCTHYSMYLRKHESLQVTESDPGWLKDESQT